MKPEAVQFPPRPLNAAGQLRRVGVELEFAGVELEPAAAIVASCYGGRVVEENPHRWVVQGSRWGDFELELDAAVLSETKFRDYLLRHGLDRLRPGLSASIDRLAGTLASSVVPYEVVTPPIPLDELAAIEILREQLFLGHAQGTESSIFHAFGLHLNPEVPATDIETVLAFLQAFLLLQSWLRADIDVDISREFTPFIMPFPARYVRLVLDPGYAPDQTRLIRDYMRFNPTRNRALDMLPLFAHLDEALVNESLQDEKVNARPTFHYRLPNSLIGQSDWSIIGEWNRWVEVERVAEDRAKLSRLTRRYLAQRDPGLAVDEWFDEIRKELS